MVTFILADNQDITRLGMQSLCNGIPNSQTLRARNKQEIISLLKQHEDAIIVTDYLLFDFTDISELVVLHQRFQQTHWVLFSEELSDQFVKRIIAEGYAFSLVNKNCDIHEIDQAIRLSIRHERFICHAITEQYISIPMRKEHIQISLTHTEVDILKEIALGKTTKEIAIERNSSFHTVNTHRKNIFRKLEVNTAYEAIRYALRAGLIDQSDYYI
ncbi:MAG: response regulator transcription factor [Bacteroidaceae bacterium]|nr:response regulator transcription factor [Bacteroidaceae bacterium]